jgi:hypothetical protein
MDGTGTAITRSAAIGYSNIGGICSKNSFSIVEYIGFNKMLLTNLVIGIVFNYIMIMILIFLILKSSLGAVHDGTGAAISCPASLNNIMNSVVGRYPDSGNLFYFSNCTINSFKAALLTSNKL